MKMQMRLSGLDLEMTWNQKLILLKQIDAKIEKLVVFRMDLRRNMQQDLRGKYHG
jgi:hypothetical protein